MLVLKLNNYIVKTKISNFCGFFFYKKQSLSKGMLLCLKVFTLKIFNQLG